MDLLRNDGGSTHPSGATLCLHSVAAPAWHLSTTRILAKRTTATKQLIMRMVNEDGK